MRTLLLLTCFILTPLQAGEIHKWVDSEGNVFYGDAPPNNVNTQNVRVIPAPSNPGRVLPRFPAQDPVTPTPADPPVFGSNLPNPDSAKTREEYACIKARKEQNVLRSSYRIQEQSADGSTRYLSEEELAERKTSVEAEIAKFCQ